MTKAQEEKREALEYFGRFSPMCIGPSLAHGKVLESVVRSQDQEILALKAQVEALRGALEKSEDGGVGGLFAICARIQEFLPEGFQRALTHHMNRAHDVLSKSHAKCLDEFKAKVRAEALRKAGDWFKGWTDMPASYERAGEALHRMAEEALRDESEDAGVGA